MRVGLLRHGRTDWNSLGVLQGRTDRPLEDDEPERLGTLAVPPPWDEADLLASPLIRARDTARLVTGRDAAVDPRLIEMNFGAWEGLSSKDLAADPSSGFRDVEDWGWDYRPPDGESPREVWARVSAALEALERDTLIVCHLVVMRVTLAVAHGWDFDGPMPFRVKRDRIYGLTMEDGRLTADAEPVRLVQRCA